jgi:hypothetical protein
LTKRAHRLGERGGIEREQVRVGQAEDRGSDRLRERAAVGEVRVGESRVPCEVVVDRVVDAFFALASVAQVQRGDSQVLEERREVRSGSERIEPERLLLPQPLAVLVGLRVLKELRPKPVPDRDVPLGVGDESPPPS